MRTQAWKSRKAAVVGILAVGLLAMSACAGGSASTPDVSESGGILTTSVYTTGPTAGILQSLAMDSLDIDEANGIDQGLVTAGETPAVVIAGTLSGQYDFVVTGTTTILDAIAQGGNLVIMCSSNVGAQTLIVRNDAIEPTGVTADASVEDRIRALKGFTIVTNPPGSGNYDLLVTILRSAGLDPDSDVKILAQSDGGAVVAGLAQGSYDASFYSAGFAENAIIAGDAQLWGSVSHGDFDVAIAGWMAVVVAVNGDVLRDRPEVVERMFDASEATLKTIRDDPDAVNAAVKPDWFPNMDQALWDLTWEQGKVSTPETCEFSKSDFEKTLSLAGDSEKYADLDYDSIVYERARG